MRALLPPLPSILDPDSGAPCLGSFRGGLPSVDFGPLGLGRLERLARHKRWVYVMIAAEDALYALAIADLGYAGSAFGFALDLAGRRLAARASFVLPPRAARVEDCPGEGQGASFRWGKSRARIERRRGESAMEVSADLPGLRLEARLETAGAPEAIGAVARVPGGRVSATEKRALLPASGEAFVEGRRHRLDGAFGGMDFTDGLLGRRTAWRWAFAQGRDRAGAPVAWNLVEGFVGEAECALWLAGELLPLGEGRFFFDARRPEAPWKIRAEAPGGGEVNLDFQPLGVHAEHRDLGLVSTRFVQPAGLFSGAIRLPERTIVLDRVLGVTEDQNAIW